MDGQASADLVRARELDAEIGVSGGDMGAPNLKSPVAKTGVPSSAGGVAGASEETPSEGPVEATKR
jgi:hypothetical protein